MQYQDGYLAPSNDAFDEVGEVNGKLVSLTKFNNATSQNPQQIPDNADLCQIIAKIVGDKAKQDESYNVDTKFHIYDKESKDTSMKNMYDIISQ